MYFFPVKNPEEEVFAESYDDQDEVNTSPQKSRNDSNPPPSSRFGMVTNAEAMEKMKFMGYPCCPNKWNIYHECTTYCQNHWNSKRSTGPEPGSEYAVKHKVNFNKFPKSVNIQKKLIQKWQKY